ncbi:glucosaminidase domain-containing protein [Furfurilactobacillus curtus]|uniref:Mannosyl-glycoprotein endo-beta-N-acetylglucosamidase-like domain-containing protein n=1 Tax=Furfurilactobacillus curtus TaxID=1746200 RepID=A0ABQ5JNN3_9LACO
MQGKVHFKMYKKGRFWCLSALAATGVGFGLISSHTSALADVVPKTQIYSTNLADVDTTTSTSNNRDSVETAISNSQQSAPTQSLSLPDGSSQAQSTVSSASTINMMSGAANPQATNSAVKLSSSATSETTIETTSAPQSNNNASSLVATSVPSQVASAQTYSFMAARSAVKNGLQTENGNTYYYINGVRQSGTQVVNGKTYYFDPATQQMKNDYFYDHNGQMYYFGNDGAEYQDQFYSNWGNMYYFGKNGARYTDQFYSNWGNMYYFGDGGVRYTDQFYYNWGKMYYFGDGGVRYTDQFYSNWGNMYYFGDDGARYTNQFYSNWGNMYYFGEGGVRYTNQFLYDDGNMYYFDGDGVRYTNRFYQNWGNTYYFGTNGALVKNTTTNLGFGNISFDDNGVIVNTDINGNQNSHQNQFLNSIMQGAIQGWKQYGILPSLTAAQAILESGWGASSLAAIYHNLFGIKGDYNGQSVYLPTYEYFNGAYQYVNAAFRAYPNASASVLDHSAFLTENSRYHNLLWVKNSDAVTNLIRQDGYATDPNYTASLRNVIAIYHLNVWDQLAFL